MNSLPAIFVSHGGPTMAVQESPARHFLQTLHDHHPSPKSILMISAHWETTEPTVGATDDLETIHDYYGFPRALYDLHYPAKGDPDLARRVAALIADANLGAASSSPRGLDHGAWLPLMLAYPDGEIPITQLSLLTVGGPAWHFDLGAALRPLRDEGVLILASGALTHNLREIDREAPPGMAADWVAAFSSWVSEQVLAGRSEDLIRYRERAPHAARNHPTEEHFLPLFVALGAATPGANGRHLHQSFNYGVLAMDAYAWD
ncbi:MAG: dioxygenase [Rhodospirillaceae bacterium]|nr:dioxygenase [Rhodospirillaceae bacterium]MBT5191548.1 dioxygenase [Rhodospirillaceae bacterium]MBT5894676.1 dioxygenase [Rhodospirillaceae bacterium]MBT6428042.1 dioxygenase [Rhodospirillaceae bacterium]MBT7756767.1 dioxygenase [Rhodospirillaceae bacterium]